MDLALRFAFFGKFMVSYFPGKNQGEIENPSIFTTFRGKINGQKGREQKISLTIPKNWKK